jgi:hypothetical protein
MANWTVKTLLDHTQELLGEPAGGYYNISSRLSLFNQAQREMVEETRALVSEARVALQPYVREYDLPADFQTFERRRPYLELLTGGVRDIEVIDSHALDRRVPGWQDPEAYEGEPRYAYVENDKLVVLPTPSGPATLVLPYVVIPDELAQEDDPPFNGVQRLNRFGVALAYRAAFVTMLARSPQVAMAMQSLYESEVRSMRHFTRSNPQNPQQYSPYSYRAGR